ncbi:hypothetical protein GMMP13_550001 [Candidatus Magnetomoraceae bacterium gMMP-13]
MSKLSDSSFVAGYADVGNSYYGTAIIGTVSGTGSGASISWSSESTFNSGAVTYGLSVSRLSDSSFVAGYKDHGNSDYGKAIIGTVSGTGSGASISWGSESTFNSTLTDYISVSRLSDSRFVAGYRDGGSNYGTAIIGTVSGTGNGASISWGSEYIFNSAETEEISVSSLNDSSFVAGYQEKGNSFYGTAIIGNLPEFCPVGIALNSGTGGTDVKIAFSGVANGLSGLSTGTKYYADESGSLTSTITDRYVGVAVSETELLIQDNSLAESNYVQKSGDTMTGVLTLNDDLILANGSGSFSETTLKAMPQSEARTIIFPDASGTVMLNTTSNTLSMNGIAYIMVQTTDDPVTNGTNLISAYNQVKELTPHGEDLSITNRAVVIVPPGKYDLGSSELVMDGEFVDLVGLSTVRDNQYIYGTSNGINTGVIKQTAQNVHIENLVVECTRSAGGLNFDSSDPAAYFPAASEAESHTNTVIRNCEFKADDTNALSMRIATTYAGIYKNCTGGYKAFGGFGGTASGKFTNCTAGNYAFGGEGTASGTFTNCAGGTYSFGGEGTTANGTFKDCTGGDGAFGGGGKGTASGTFKDCTGGDGAFGGEYGSTIGGFFWDCVGGSNSFGFGGVAKDCYDGIIWKNGMLLQ